MTTTARELAENIIERANDSRDPLFWKPALITELTLTIERAEPRGEARGRESVLSRVSEDKIKDFAQNVFESMDPANNMPSTNELLTIAIVRTAKGILAKLKEPT